MIKNLIGKLTYPKDAVKLETTGEHFIPVYGIPTFSSNYNWRPIDSTHPFNYRKIEQNWIGKWIQTDSYLAKYTPINPAA